MKICFLEGDMSRRGGTERMTALLANTLSETDQVWIISLKLEDDRVFFDLNENVRHKVLPRVSGKFTIVKQIQKIHEFAYQNQIDWLINVDIGMSIYGIPSVKGTKAKVITWEHANFFNNWNSRIFPYFRRFAANYSNVMVVLTERDKKNYQDNIKFNTPIYAIANPIQQHNFSYDSTSKKILSAGLLLPIKGFECAISIAKIVLSKHPDWQWIICGEGPERKYLQSLIEKAQLEKQILLPGTVHDMSEQYQKAAMFVMTSKMEGLPMVLLEAKSWGLPLVSFDIMTGPSDIIRDDVNGYLVKPYDIERMAECIEILINKKELRKQFSENSQLDIEKFSLENIVKRWKEIMKSE